MEVGEREIIYLSLHCHHQNDFCIKVGSDESHFNVSLIVRDKVTRQSVSTDYNQSDHGPMYPGLPASRVYRSMIRLKTDQGGGDLSLIHI